MPVRRCCCAEGRGGIAMDWVTFSFLGFFFFFFFFFLIEVMGSG